MDYSRQAAARIPERPSRHAGYQQAHMYVNLDAVHYRTNASDKWPYNKIGSYEFSCKKGLNTKLTWRSTSIKNHIFVPHHPRCLAAIGNFFGGYMI
jgi:hypothetical protein